MSYTLERLADHRDHSGTPPRRPLQLQDFVVRFLAGLHAFYDELKRRHVFRVAAGYVVGAFFLLEASNLVFQGLEVPASIYRALTIIVLFGFPVVLVLSWAFQWTSQGIRREEDVVDGALPEPVGVSAGARAGGTSRSVRAFAIVTLSIVVATVGMGVSVPYMYARRDQAGMTEQASRSGVQLASNSATQRLAVLPFVSLTGDDESGFADGLAEDITSTLAQLGGVDVVSRTTSEAYRDSEKTARVIGSELGVGLILEGTVRRAGDRVRVTVQLIDARTDRHLWANSYDRDLIGDVFRTQSELAQDIVTAIEAVVYPGRADEAENRRLAFDIASKGDELLAEADPVYDGEAERLFVDALEHDSTNPVAHAGIAQTLVSRVHAGGPATLLDSAARHVRIALDRAPDLADAHAAQAFVFLSRGEMDSMHVALSRAIQLDESGEAFEFKWEDRIRMISPEALESARERIVGSVGGERRFRVHEMPAQHTAPPAQHAAPPASSASVTP